MGKRSGQRPTNDHLGPELPHSTIFKRDCGVMPVGIDSSVFVKLHGSENQVFFRQPSSGFGTGKLPPGAFWREITGTTIYEQPKLEDRFLMLKGEEPVATQKGICVREAAHAVTSTCKAEEVPKEAASIMVAVGKQSGPIGPIYLDSSKAEEDFQNSLGRKVQRPKQKGKREKSLVELHLINPRAKHKRLAAPEPLKGSKVPPLVRVAAPDHIRDTQEVEVPEEPVESRGQKEAKEVLEAQRQAEHEAARVDALQKRDKSKNYSRIKRENAALQKKLEEMESEAKRLNAASKVERAIENRRLTKAKEEQPAAKQDEKNIVSPKAVVLKRARPDPSDDPAEESDAKKRKVDKAHGRAHHTAMLLKHADKLDKRMHDTRDQMKRDLLATGFSAGLGPTEASGDASPGTARTGEIPWRGDRLAAAQLILNDGWMDKSTEVFASHWHLLQLRASGTSGRMPTSTPPRRSRRVVITTSIDTASG